MKLIAHSESDMPRIGRAIRTLPFPVAVSIDVHKKKRSLEANARYWALLTEISRQAPPHMGGEWHDPEVWHEYACRRFLGMDPGPYGEGVRKRTSKLNPSAFCEYMAEVEAWAVDEFDLRFEYEK